MKFDPILQTKLLFLGEKILDKNYSELNSLLDPALVSLLGMQQQEIWDLIFCFETKKIFERIEEIKMVEDEDGASSEAQYEYFIVDKKKLGKEVTFLKKDLAEKPFLSRSDILPISYQIQRKINIQNLVKILAHFHSESNFASYLSAKQYTLADILFCLAYSKNQGQFLSLLSEFFNPIYYNLDYKKESTELFEFVNRILTNSLSREDYQEWLIEVKKYIQKSSEKFDNPTDFKIRKSERGNRETIGVEEIAVGPLVYRTDGAICFKGNPLELRSQIKTLCIFLMKRHKELVDSFSIKEELIRADKRSRISNSTISKYVSEFHKEMRKHFKKQVIFSQKNEGYFFDIERDS